MKIEDENKRGKGRNNPELRDNSAQGKQAAINMATFFIAERSRRVPRLLQQMQLTYSLQSCDGYGTLALLGTI